MINKCFKIKFSYKYNISGSSFTIDLKIDQYQFMGKLEEIMKKDRLISSKMEKNERINTYMVENSSVKIYYIYEPILGIWQRLNEIEVEYPIINGRLPIEVKKIIQLWDKLNPPVTKTFLTNISA